MTENPFEFGIFQRVRRRFQKTDDVIEKMIDHLDSLSDVRAALIAVIEQWGPITFADETIEANKKKKISIKRENGVVKFSVEKSDSAATEWPDETRIDIIGSNGNDGEHYAQD